MTYMERSSRICTHILNLNRSHILFWQLTKAIQILINCHQGIINHIGLQEEINKARTSNLYPVKPVTRNAAGNFLSNLPRCHVKSTCRLHCHIGSKVTKLLFGRNLQHNIRQLSLWQGTSFNSWLNSILYSGNQNLFNIQNIISELFQSPGGFCLKNHHSQKPDNPA